MKTAAELAMERLGGVRSYTDKQKTDMAAIDARYEAKKAEETLSADRQLAEANADPAKADEIRQRMAHEIARLNEKKEREKDAIRDRR